MKFVMGDFMGFGVIGLVYEGMGNYILSHVLFFILIALTVIGLISTIKWLFSRKHKKETPGQKWMRTGRM